jgi:hypothetical protein
MNEPRGEFAFESCEADYISRTESGAGVVTELAMHGQPALDTTAERLWQIDELDLGNGHTSILIGWIARATMAGGNGDGKVDADFLV